MTFKLILAAIGMVFLAGCAGQSVGATKTLIQTSSEFNEFFLEDAIQANIIAKRTDDPLAVQCWTYLEEFARANAPDPDVEHGEVVGALSAYQKARAIRRNVFDAEEISDDFRIACGPMLLDSAAALSRLGISLPVSLL